MKDCVVYSALILPTTTLEVLVFVGFLRLSLKRESWLNVKHVGVRGVLVVIEKLFEMRIMHLFIF